MRKRNKFSLSHYRLLTGDMGNLIPLTCYEALPGDSIQQSTSCLIRVTPLLKPVMHPIRVRIHHWFVPLRLIWAQFEDFITGGPLGTSAPTFPYFADTTVGESSLLDYLGAPVGSGRTLSALPVRAYNLVWNKYYRDQDLSSELTVNTASGEDGSTPYALMPVCWEKDYFTASRPWDALGDNITIPLGGSAWVYGDDDSNRGINVSDGTTTRALYGNGTTTPQLSGSLTANPLDFVGQQSLYADLSAATGIDIADLRLALQLQKIQEARARYGHSYVDYLRYLGVRPADSRLQQPEYIGGGRQVIQFSEVLSTDGANTGDMKGHGIAAMRTNRFRRYFEEHGLVLTLMSVVPKTIYTGGQSRMWSRQNKEDYHQKELEQIGDQMILNKEIYADHATPGGTFGFQGRYDEYRSIPSGVSGEFLTTESDWHLGRIFASDPALNESFVACNPTKRVLASQSTDSLYVMANHSIQARRNLSRRK